MSRFHFTRKLLALLCAFMPLLAPAQELRRQATPFSVWLDFRALASPTPPKVSLPIWLESLHSSSVDDASGEPAQTTYRLRFRQVGDLNRELLFRLYFDDLKGRAPVVTGWSEQGDQVFEHGPFGAALGLPASATVVLLMPGVSTVDITVSGDGASVRGAFLSSLRQGKMRYSYDFSLPTDVVDGFDNLPSVPPPVDDTLLLGRIRATLDTGIVKLTPRETTSQVWEFELAADPLIAVLGFEILNADPLSPLDVVVNGRAVGPVALRTPDLADPGYDHVIRPVDRGVQFHYGGWLQGQKTIPGSALRAGWNKIEIRLHPASGPVAVRSLDLQLRGH